MRKNSSGFTLVEVLITVVLMVTLFTALIGAFVSIKSVSMLTRRKAQAIQVVRGQLELLKVSTFSAIADSTSSAAYDAGSDGTWGTSDDLTGTIAVSVRDHLDMDGDGNANETSIDIDADGTNDTSAVKPVRVTFSWTQNFMGRTRTCSVFADTLIAS